MFKIDATPSYWWPVTVQQPADGGAFLESTLEVLLRRLDAVEYDRLMAEVGQQRLDDREVSRRVVLGFRKVVDAAGTELPSNAENLERLLRVPLMASSIVRAFFDSRSGAAEKNFARPPASGHAAAPNSTTHH